MVSNCLMHCFSTGGPRPSGGPWSSFGGPQAFHILLKIRLSDTNFIQMYKKVHLISYKSNHKQQNKLI